MDAWAPVGPERFGLSRSGPATNTPSELNSISSPYAGAAGEAKPWSPSNPLFWFGVIAAATFGLAAVSTTARVGKATATVSVGSTK